MVGNLVKKLTEDKLLDDTFIFYFGDHGGVLPRSKGYVYETGLHVPLVVYTPKNFRQLSDFQPGQRTKGFVEFVDFGPTALHLAGVPKPSHMNGRPFLGRGVSAAEVSKRNSTLGYADRFDEKYDLVRSLRIEDLKYIRNFNAIYPNGLENQYRYKMAAYEQWREQSKSGTLSETQNRFFLPKPAEELYDVETDPYETNNLVHDVAFQEKLKRMRNQLTQRMKAMPDTSLYPESVIIKNTQKQSVLFSSKHKKTISQLIDIANLSLKTFNQAAQGIETALHSDSQWHRYWGLIVCSSFGKEASQFIPRAEELLIDEQPEVRLRAIEFIALLGQQDPIPHYIGELERSKNQATTMSLLNSLVFYTDFVQNPRQAVELGKIPFDQERFIRHRIDYLNNPRLP